MAIGRQITAGMPYSRATEGPCATGDPVSVTKPPAVMNSSVQPGSVVAATRMSPGSMRAVAGSWTTRAVPVARPGAAGMPCQVPSGNSSLSSANSGTVPSDSSSPGTCRRRSSRWWTARRCCTTAVRSSPLAAASASGTRRYKMSSASFSTPRSASSAPASSSWRRASFSGNNQANFGSSRSPANDRDRRSKKPATAARTGRVRDARPTS